MSTNKHCQKVRKILAAGTDVQDNPTVREHLAGCSDCGKLLDALNQLDQVLPALPAHDVNDEVVAQLLARPELAVPARSGRNGQESRWRQRLSRARDAGQWLLLRRRMLLAAGTPVVVILLAVLIGSQIRSNDSLVGFAKVQAVREPMPTTQVDELAETEEQLRWNDQDVDKLDEAETYLADGAADKQLGMVAGVAPPPAAPAEAAPELKSKELRPDQPARQRLPAPRKKTEEADREMRSFNNFSDQVLPDLGVDYGNVTSDPLEPGNAGGKEQNEAHNLVAGGIVDSSRRAEGYSQTYERYLLQASASSVTGRASDQGGGSLPGVTVTLSSPAHGTRTAITAADGSYAMPAPPGDYTAQASLAGFAPMQWAVTVAAGQTTQLGFTMIPTELGEEITVTSSYATISGRTSTEDTGPAPIEVTGIAREFLNERSSVANLSFKEPHGYWSNTYVPGDRDLRLLQARLMGWDRSQLAPAAGQELRLHDASRQVVQPYDPPRSSALAVYLHADRRGLSGRSRLLMEVGLKGTPRHSGHRPAMNIGLILDLRGQVPLEVIQVMRAVVDAFAGARDMGDRFSLTVAGRPGGLVVPHGDFSYGPLQVAMRELFTGSRAEHGGFGLSQALAQAIETVSAADDPTTPLGSSVVILITGQTIGDQLATLGEQAYASGVEGVPVSVVGIGGSVDLAELDQIVLAGQGNRRLLHTAAEAEDLVDRELSAVGKVIARAVRLRIRLAPGVQLVDVIGSHRLDQVRAQEVRDAEVSIDRRLSRNLGITADRGLDEEGIQIVIPTFYAGDSHVILLDLVAPGKGSIADVTVRYKDLVYLRNGLARDNLSLGSSEATSGPLELNVLKNLLAHDLGECLEQAGLEVGRGDFEAARSRLSELKTLLQEIPIELPGFENDPDLANDVAMLDEYLSLLAAGAELEADQLAESLRYASQSKLLKVQELIAQ